MVVLALAFVGDVEAAPMNPMTALSLGGTAVSSLTKGWGGVTDFISNVRSFFGKAGEFTTRNGFD